MWSLRFAQCAGLYKRRTPYLLIWKDERHGGEIKEAVRLKHFVACGKEGTDCVELKRTSGTEAEEVIRGLPVNFFPVSYLPLCFRSFE